VVVVMVVVVGVVGVVGGGGGGGRREGGLVFLFRRKTGLRFFFFFPRGGWEVVKARKLCSKPRTYTECRGLGYADQSGCRLSSRVQEECRWEG